jgi:ABC-2 type transport system permease protein
MNAKQGLMSSLRIIWAITVKDIVETLKNREMLAGLGSVIFLIVLYQFLPLLSSGGGLPAVLIYDAAGSSSVTTALAESVTVMVYTYPSQSVMEEKLSHGDVPELGLVIPAGIDQALAAGETPMLDGYVMAWVSSADAQELVQLVEQTVSDMLGHEVQVSLEGHSLYPEPDSFGKPFLVSATIVIVVFMMGMWLTPRLMLDEKTSRTMDVLLVSPASYSQIVASKALSGVIGAVFGVVTILAMNLPVIHHWWLTLLVSSCGLLFAVALGLLVGVLVQVKHQLQVWVMVLAQPLLLPVFLVIFEDIIPAPVIAAMGLIPSVTTARLLRISFSNGAPLAMWGPGVALILGVTAAILGVVVWQVRRSDR